MFAVTAGIDITAPPTVFENGFTVDIVDEENKYVVKKTTRTHYVNRTTILSMNDFSANPETPVCETGDVISVHTTSATITSTFNNIPTGAECGIKVLNNMPDKDIIHESIKFDKTIVVGNSNLYNRLQNEMKISFYPYGIFEIYTDDSDDPKALGDGWSFYWQNRKMKLDYKK